MGFLSGIIGKKPHFVERSAPEAAQLDTAHSLQAQSNDYSPVAQTYLGSLGDTTRLQSRARGVATADAMQGSSAPGYDPMHPGMVSLDRSLARTRALTRMGWAGADQAKNNGFYERMQAVQFGRKLRQSDPNAGLAQIAADNAATSNMLSATRAATSANAIGTLAGAAFSAYRNYNDPNNYRSGAPSSIVGGTPTRLLDAPITHNYSPVMSSTETSGGGWRLQS